ncbi:winged helix-turn-helix transcriptional regulator [Pedobacter paludis]|uniref:MarR family transcriptional regulator n=1 Tax=Pedobacter paludis TaxID=2203212 RepID=A0A317EZQ7_9SPHI|nr:helix-turn-helix domain-containing protein [Pedobacter paludis]PWS31962.1 MarR family transcriptional regulator [Pedobacter paludis]
MTKKRQEYYTCSMEAALNVIGGKWKLTILNRLLSGPKRYGELHKSIPGIAEKMLTQQLRELEEDQIVERKVYPVVPPKVEYSFTESGYKLKDVFKSLEIWGNNFQHRIHPLSLNEADDKNCYTFQSEIPKSTAI